MAWNGKNSHNVYCVWIYQPESGHVITKKKYLEVTKDFAIQSRVP